MTPSSVPTDKVACSSFLPIYWSKADSDKTLAQIKEHNASWKALCQKTAASPKSDKKASAKPTTFADRWYGGVKVVATAFR